MPLVSVQVSGLWQNLQPNVHSAVQATRRIPGPSTAEPVVKEWRKPKSPLSSALRMVGSGTAFPRATRSSYGLPASIETRPGTSLFISFTVEGTGDDIHLLFPGQLDKIHGVAGHPERQARIF